MFRSPLQPVLWTSFVPPKGGFQVQMNKSALLMGYTIGQIILRMKEEKFKLINCLEY